MQASQEAIVPVTVILSDETAKKMQSVAVPLTDTYETVIIRAVDALIEKVHGTSPAAQAVATAGTPWVLPYAADAAPNLTFTKPTAITLEGQPLQKGELYWNPFLFKVIGVAAKKLSPEQLRQALLLNFKEGNNEGSGFQYIPDANLSAQGADANNAWKATIHLIKSAQLKVDVVFRWDVKEGAAKPGQIGRMTYEPV
jgi:hypothetical protein